MVFIKRTNINSEPFLCVGYLNTKVYQSISAFNERDLYLTGSLRDNFFKLIQNISSLE
jgi:hypothetical protein